MARSPADRVLLGDVELPCISQVDLPRPMGEWLHVFEMPLLGYGGYLPFALELYALYHWVSGVVGDKETDYVKISPD